MATRTAGRARRAWPVRAVRCVSTPFSSGIDPAGVDEPVEPRLMYESLCQEGERECAEWDHDNHEMEHPQMPRAATIKSLPGAFRMMKAMQTQGIEWARTTAPPPRRPLAGRLPQGRRLPEERPRRAAHPLALPEPRGGAAPAISYRIRPRSNPSSPPFTCAPRRPRAACHARRRSPWSSSCASRPAKSDAVWMARTSSPSSSRGSNSRTEKS